MSKLDATLASVLADPYTKNAARVRELAMPLTNTQFWQRPFPFGNSFGHLVLHLTGNLNYYIGAQMAKSGYVRDRAREFTDPSPRRRKRPCNASTVRSQSLCKQFVRSRQTTGRKNIQAWPRTVKTVWTWSSNVPLTCSITLADNLSRLRMETAVGQHY